MNVIVPRTYTEILPRDEAQNQEKNPQPLEAFRSAAAYVLLGDPGSGKTTVFQTECGALGENACLITARNFLTLDMNSHPEWRGKTLFIDGLDEIRAGAPDARTPFDEIRRRLDELDRPRFRLSCREADWLGDNDRRHLASVSQDSQVTVLRLNPLTGFGCCRNPECPTGHCRRRCFYYGSPRARSRRSAHKPTEPENAGRRCGPGRWVAGKPPRNFRESLSGNGP